MNQQLRSRYSIRQLNSIRAVMSVICNLHLHFMHQRFNIYLQNSLLERVRFCLAANIGWLPDFSSFHSAVNDFKHVEIKRTCCTEIRDGTLHSYYHSLWFSSLCLLPAITSTRYYTIFHCTPVRAQPRSLVSRTQRRSNQQARSNTCTALSVIISCGTNHLCP